MKTGIVAAIEHYERQSAGEGSLMEARTDALDRYFGRPYGDEVEGHSQVVMRDVCDTVEWIKPSLMKVFAGGDEVVKFNPRGPEDEQAAEQETEYCNFVLMQKNGGFLILHDWFHDALLQKNGYVLTQWEESSTSQLDEYVGLSDDEFALLVGNEEVEVVEHGQEIDALGMTRHTVKVRSTVTYGCPKVTNIPPERVVVAADWPGVDLQDCPFIEVIEYPTISELRQRGYEVDDNIADDASVDDDEYETHRATWSSSRRSSATAWRPRPRCAA